MLTVGLTNPRIEWLLVTIAPSMFSGIAAGLLLIPMLMVPLYGGEAAPAAKTRLTSRICSPRPFARLIF